MDAATHKYLIGTICTANQIGLYDFQIHLNGNDWFASITVFQGSILKSSIMGLFTIGKDEPIPDIRPHMNLKVISCILEEVTNMLLLTFEDQSWIEISPDNSEYEAYIISSKFGFWEYFYPH